MNKKEKLASGFVILFLVGLIGFAVPLAAAADNWNDNESPYGQPITLNTGGVGISVGALNYSSSNPTYIYPGQSIQASANVSNIGTGNESLIVSLDNTTGSGTDLLAVSTAQVWVDTSGGAHTTGPQSGDYVLDTTGMEPFVSTLPSLPLSTVPIPTGTNTMSLPTGTLTTPYVVNYILKVDSAAPKAAEREVLNVGTSLTGGDSTPTY